MSEAKCVAVVGIDGGSWNVLRWLIREGYMPNLSRMIENGVCGCLRSTIPPVTGAAWLAIATGLNPGKTGVIDFIKHVGDFAFEPVSSSDFRGKSIWDYLSSLGYSVAVLDYPMLYPAYPVNGVMLCSWGGRVSTYPPSLISDINRIVERYDIFVEYHLEKYGDIDLFIEDMNKAIEKKQWNLLIDVLSFTDWLQHRMWHYIDPSHPLYPGDENSSRYRRIFAEYWRCIDEYIGEVSEVYDNVVIISDHGFGPQWGVFNLAKWLCIHGFIKTRHGFKKRFKKALVDIATRMNMHKLLPRKVVREVRKRGLSLVGGSLELNLEESKVVVPQYTIPFGAIHVNPRFVEQRNEILNELTNLLIKLNEELGRDLKVEIWRLKELYQGDKVDLLPDVVFTINDWSCVIVKDLEKDFIYLNAPYSPRHTGSHRLYGIFIACGKDIKRGLRIDQISVFDIAPTILYMFDAPIPKEMDGKVLREMLRYGEMREPRYTSILHYRIERVKRRLRK